MHSYSTGLVPAGLPTSEDMVIRNWLFYGPIGLFSRVPVPFRRQLFHKLSQLTRRFWNKAGWSELGIPRINGSEVILPACVLYQNR